MVQMNKKPKAGHCNVALLRGINVGGKGIISMKELKKSFEKAGFTNVETYINSGNVIFESKEKNLRKLEKQIEQILNKNHKLQSKVIIKNLAEIKKLNIFLDKLWKGKESMRNSVLFLSKAVDSKKILKEIRFSPDIEEVVYKPGVILWSVDFKDVTKSKMLKINTMQIYKEITVRNWNTTRKILEIMKKHV
jgi:uncharacterized protein (DUF1697 family)